MFESIMKNIFRIFNIINIIQRINFFKEDIFDVINLIMLYLFCFLLVNVYIFFDFVKYYFKIENE